MMCRACVRKFVADEPQPDEDALAEAEKEEERKEREMAAAILSALLLIKPWVKTYSVIQSMPWDQFSAALSGALVPGFAIHDLAGAAVVSGIGVFDPLDRETVTRQSSYRGQFIKEFGDETQKALNLAYAWGVKRGLDQATVEKILTAVAGLNSRQTSSVLSQWVSRQESGASPKMLDRMLDAAVRKLLKERAKNVGQQEGWSLFQLGQWSAMDQQERAGAVVVKDWDVTADERLCERCAAVPVMNPNGVPLGEPFRTPDGPRMFSPLHNRCRCRTLYRIQPGNF